MLTVVAHLLAQGLLSLVDIYAHVRRDPAVPPPRPYTHTHTHTYVQRNTHTNSHATYTTGHLWHYHPANDSSYVCL
jgi:hypothetical protein